jgi:gamma-glutamyl hercynylcysteine S-oxide synthase
MHDLVVRDLEQARDRTLWLTDLDEPTLVAQHDPLMSPLAWDVAHVGQQEELWLLRGGDPPRPGMLPPDVDPLYDAFKHPRAERSSLPLLPPVEARAYDHEVRGRVLDLIERTLADELFTAGMVVQHEEQHDETTLATLQLRQGPPVLLGRRPLPPGRDVEPDQVFVRGGPFALYVDAASEPFSLDNERPAHTVDVGPFWIGRVPVSNRQWREFIGDGGYQRQDLWSARGWAHRIEVGLERPLFWTAEGTRWRFGSRRKFRRLSPCSMSATSRPRPTPAGPAGGCPPRPSGRRHARGIRPCAAAVPGRGDRSRPDRMWPTSAAWACGRRRSGRIRPARRPTGPSR